MKISERLQSVARLFLDTAPIVYYVEKNPRYLVKVQEIFRQIDVGTLTAVTSPVTLAECLVSADPIGTDDLTSGLHRSDPWRLQYGLRTFWC
jgi:hypothetical protein